MNKQEHHTQEQHFNIQKSDNLNNKHNNDKKAAMSFQQQSGPFWNFVAELNEQGPSHPWFTQRRANRFGDKAGGNGQEQPNAFWDFVAELNEQGRAHPWFAQRRANRRGENADANAQEQTNPWVGTMPFRGWRGNGRGHGHHGLRAQAVRSRCGNA